MRPDPVRVLVARFFFFSWYGRWFRPRPGTSGLKIVPLSTGALGKPHRCLYLVVPLCENLLLGQECLSSNACVKLVCNLPPAPPNPPACISRVKEGPTDRRVASSQQSHTAPPEGGAFRVAESGMSDIWHRGFGASHKRIIQSHAGCLFSLGFMHFARGNVRQSYTLLMSLWAFLQTRFKELLRPIEIID